MFDSVLFGVAIVTDERFESFDKGLMHYSYAWIYDDEPEDKSKDVSDDLAKVMSGSGEVEKFIPRYTNQAINFTGEDMGGDSIMVETLLVLIVIMAFILAITINNTIVKEAGTIGTLGHLVTRRRRITGALHFSSDPGYICSSCNRKCSGIYSI